jgi:hypothetical protein
MGMSDTVSEAESEQVVEEEQFASTPFNVAITFAGTLFLLGLMIMSGHPKSGGPRLVIILPFLMAITGGWSAYGFVDLLKEIYDKL